MILTLILTLREKPNGKVLSWHSGQYGRTCSKPGFADKPQRIVKFSAERDMNKAFINLIIKSFLNGLKETMIMSKENKQTYREKKKELKKEKKKQNKKEKN
jgi:hypothetical protein